MALDKFNVNQTVSLFGSTHILRFNGTGVGTPVATGNEAEGFLSGGGVMWLDQATSLRGYNNGSLRLIGNPFLVNGAFFGTSVCTFQFLVQDLAGEVLDPLAPGINRNKWYECEFTLAETSTIIRIKKRNNIISATVPFNSVTIDHGGPVTTRALSVEWSVTPDISINAKPVVQMVARLGVGTDYSAMSIVLCETIDYGFATADLSEIQALEDRYLNGIEFDVGTNMWVPTDLVNAELESIDMYRGTWDDPQFIIGGLAELLTIIIQEDWEPPAPPAINSQFDEDWNAPTPPGINSQFDETWES